ncbi:hypothetical protein HY468_04510 [Candidatus Roizmanbacteria bacterium]|nr:hypothetical protein [Candidatus Roizmanbacteria bacterium]
MDTSSQPGSSEPAGQQPATQQSGGSKEVEMPTIVEAPIETVPEFQIPKEVSPHLKKVGETIELPPDLKQMGVTNAPQYTPVTAPAQNTPQLPLTDDQIGAGLQSDFSTSFRWLAEWCLKQIKRLHMHLAKVGAHFIRVRDI